MTNMRQENEGRVECLDGAWRTRAEQKEAERKEAEGSVVCDYFGTGPDDQEGAAVPVNPCDAGSARVMTAEEMRQKFVEYVQAVVRECAAAYTDPEKLCRRTASDILVALDGAADGLPAFDLVARPHEDDEAFHRDEGANWWPDGAVLNEDVMLHDIFSARQQATNNDKPRSFVK